MRIVNKKVYYLKSKVIVEDNEGGKYPGYEEQATLIQANIYPASGKLQAELYGEKLNYMMNMLYDGPIHINEGDGICVGVKATEPPDYKVVSIKRYSHLVIELMKI